MTAVTAMRITVSWIFAPRKPEAFQVMSDCVLWFCASVFFSSVYRNIEDDMLRIDFVKPGFLLQKHVVYSLF